MILIVVVNNYSSCSVCAVDVNDVMRFEDRCAVTFQSDQSYDLQLVGNFMTLF